MLKKGTVPVGHIDLSGTRESQERDSPLFQPEWLDTLLTLRAIGRSFTLPRWAILRHIVNHASYHRGQIASKLKRFGIEQPNTDFFWWMLEQVPQEG